MPTQQKVEEKRKVLRDFAESVLYQDARGHEHSDVEIDRWADALFHQAREEERKRIAKEVGDIYAHSKQELKFKKWVLQTLTPTKQLPTNPKGE